LIKNDDEHDTIQFLDFNRFVSGGVRAAAANE
jgi:hypothetical protein